MAIEHVWSTLTTSGELGGAKRIDPHHPVDLYGAIDQAGRPGILLVTDHVPPPAPSLGALEIVIAYRSDGRWNIGVWLRAEGLAPLFGRLCDDLIESIRQTTAGNPAGFLIARLGRWKKLLEGGYSDVLEPHVLRGLVGELVIFRECLALWPTLEVVQNWVGPLDAPQDFTLPGVRLEVKTIRPGASHVRINSADQLDVTDARLLLGVVQLASAASSPDSFSPSALVNNLTARVAEAGDIAMLEFESRLAAAGYWGRPEYDQQFFRTEAVRFFEVRDSFPRLIRADLPEGVSEISYLVELGPCSAFETQLR